MLNVHYRPSFPLCTLRVHRFDNQLNNFSSPSFSDALLRLLRRGRLLLRWLRQLPRGRRLPQRERARGSHRFVSFLGCLFLTSYKVVFTFCKFVYIEKVSLLFTCGISKQVNKVPLVGSILLLFTLYFIVPDFVSKPIDIWVNEGDTIKLPCRVDKLGKTPPSCMCTWLMLFLMSKAQCILCFEICVSEDKE